MRNTLRFKGMTLLELLLVLAVTAIIVIMAAQYYSNTQVNARVTLILKQVGHIQHAASEYIQAQRGVDLSAASEGKNDVSSLLITAAYIAPSDIANPYSRGGSYTIRILAKPTLAVQISIANMNTTACQRLKLRFAEAYPDGTLLGCSTKMKTAILYIPLTVKS